MKWRRNRGRLERYAGLLAWLENKINDRLHQWADLLQLKSDQLSGRQKYILFTIFCVVVSAICATIIFNAFK